MTDEKTESVCRHCRQPQHNHNQLVGHDGASHYFTPAEPEAKEVEPVMSHAEHLVIENWKLYEKASAERAAAQAALRVSQKNAAHEADTVQVYRAKLAAVYVERDAAIERAEAARKDADAFAGENNRAARALSELQGHFDEAIRQRNSNAAALAAVTAERDALQDEREPERLEVFRLRTAARAMLDTFEYRERHTLDETAWERFETARCLLRDVIDPTKPAEHPRGFDISAEETPAEPKRCTCVEHAEYGAMVDCPVHGVERPERPRGVVQWATDTLGIFICSPRIAAYVAAEIASWDAKPTPLSAKCEWWDTGDEGTDRCESGKPATHITCEFTPPARVCEDHKCRCKQPPQPIIPPAVDPRDARVGSLDSDPLCDALAAELREFKNDPHASAAVRYLEAIKRRNARIAELQHLLRVEQGCSGASRASARHAEMAAEARIAELEADRDQQRARADAAEARCGEVRVDAAWEQRRRIAYAFRRGQHMQEIVSIPLVTDANATGK